MDEQAKRYKTDEERFQDIKSKTVPFEQSIYGRSPLFREKQTSTSKEYSEVEVFQQQQIYKENYHNPRLKELMGIATEVLLKIMEKEKED